MKEEKRWFVLSRGKVTGPFDPNQIENDSQIKESLIWGRGQPEWLSIDRWKMFWTDQELQQSKAKAPERLWRIRIGETEYKPVSYDQMIQNLRTYDNLAEVMIWTEGYSEWREVFQIHKIMDELGVSRRAHPRVPIAGQVMCEGTTGTFVARALSVSEGGLGMIETPAIKIGERFKVVLKSPNLYTPLHATAEVVYVGSDGYCGLKFIGIQTESKSTIIEYVKKFLDTKTPASL